MMDVITLRDGKDEIPLAPFFKGGDGNCAYQSRWSPLLEGGEDDYACHAIIDDLRLLSNKKKELFIWEGNRNV